METVMDSSSSSSTAAALVNHSCPPEEDDDGGETRIKDLSDDLIIEIFARLPGKSVVRFKCISKYWYSLVSSPDFISMHSTHSHRNTKIVSFLRSYCSSSTSTTTLSFRFGEHLEEEDLTVSDLLNITDFKTVGCLNGVVCLSLADPPQMYVLWNPATKQVRQIWGPPTDRSRFGVWYGSVLSFDRATNVFKVAQFKFIPLDDEGETRAQVNVFSTATNSWTNKSIVVPYQILRISFYPGDTTCVNGFIYWLVGITTFSNIYILSYNMSDEVFQMIRMPSCHGVFHSLTAYKGSLAMFLIDHSTEVDVDVWALNDFDGGGGNQSWSEILTCKLSSEVNSVAGILKKDGHDLILFYSNYVRSFSLYDPENGETKILLAGEYILNTILYSESLVSLHNQGCKSINAKCEIGNVLGIVELMDFIVNTPIVLLRQSTGKLSNKNLRDIIDLIYMSVLGVLVTD